MTRVGIVLGAGGITGIAWLLGALEAIRQHSGFDPADAAVIAGTSAGAIAAVTVAARVPTARLLQMAEEPAVLRAATAEALERRAAAGGDAAPRRLPWPGSLALGVSGLTSAQARHRVTSLVGFLPRGPQRGDEIRGLTADAVRGGWPAAADQPRLLLGACDFRTGTRVMFGAEGAPPAPLEDAVVASCAIPAYYEPVRIGGREYVDGGLHSLLNADAVLPHRCDVVLCLSPFAARTAGSPLDAAVFGAARRAAAWQAANEAALLRRAGAQVVTLHPGREELRAMGLNMMDRGHSRKVLETTTAAVAARLDEALTGVDLTGGGDARPPLALAG